MLFRSGARFGLAILSLFRIGTSEAQATTKHAWGFVTARIDSRSAHYVYTGYGYDAAFIVGALVDNPRTDYTEQILGVGARAPLHGSDTQFAAIALCNASDARYVQLYYLPTVTIGRVEAGTTLEAYLPLEAAGVSQFAITSLTIVSRLRGPLSAGLSYELSAAQRTTTSHGLGVTLRVALPSAEVGLDALGGLAHAPPHARVSFRAFY